MRLSPATAGDVEEVVGLERTSFGADAWSRDSVLVELTGPRRTAVVARTGTGELAGYAVSATAGEVTDLQRVAVEPGHRRAGLARRLLAAVDTGHGMLLEVSADNAPALALYGSEGFTEIARRGGYYRDGSDAVVMKREASGRRERGPEPGTQWAP
ncbi:MAG: GNAT family N-acetyltransferase [Nocardioidaceae bacterium]